jgi:hypothetical protein
MIKELLQKSTPNIIDMTDYGVLDANHHAFKGFKKLEGKRSGRNLYQVLQRYINEQRCILKNFNILHSVVRTRCTTRSSKPLKATSEVASFNNTFIYTSQKIEFMIINSRLE